MAGRVLKPGDIIGGYAVVRHLGAGGSGRVYLVRDDAGQQAALKTVDAHEDPVAGQRLRREVAALQAVRHEAVPRILDAELDDVDTFVVFEFIPGQCLSDHVAAKGPLAGEELAAMAERVAGALEAAHAAGVVHRDVTPANVMMSPHGAVLIDFGLSHRDDDARLTKEGLVSGTAGYVAPEVIDGAEPGTGADRWSWAATVAFAATGQAPFGVGNSAIRRTLSGKWKVPRIPGGETLHAALTLPSDARPGMRDVVAALRGATTVLHYDDAPEVDEPGVAAMPPTRVMQGPPVPGVPDDSYGDLEAEGYPDLGGVDEDGYEDYDDYEDFADASGEFVLPASSDLAPPWEGADRRPLLIAGWTIAAASLAAVAPIVSVVVVVMAALVGRTAYRRADLVRMWPGRLDKKRARAAHRLAMPWHVLRSLGELVPAIVSSAVIGVGTSLAGWHLVSSGALAATTDTGQHWGHAGALIAGALVFAGGMWWGLWSWGTREGSYIVANWFAPTRGVSTAWVLVAFIVVALVAVAIDAGATPWWWPAPDMPGES